MAQRIRPQTIKEFQKSVASLDESIIVEEVQKRRDVIEVLNAQGVIKVKIEGKEKPFWQSKKFWGGVIALAILLFDFFNPDPNKELWIVALPVLVYIFGQGLADLGKNKTIP